MAVISRNLVLLKALALYKPFTYLLAHLTCSLLIIATESDSLNTNTTYNNIELFAQWVFILFMHQLIGCCTSVVNPTVAPYQQATFSVLCCPFLRAYCTTKSPDCFRIFLHILMLALFLVNSCWFSLNKAVYALTCMVGYNHTCHA